MKEREDSWWFQNGSGSLHSVICSNRSPVSPAALFFSTSTQPGSGCTDSQYVNSSCLPLALTESILVFPLMWISRVHTEFKTVIITSFMPYLFLLPFLWFLDSYFCSDGLIIYEPLLLLGNSWGSI